MLENSIVHRSHHHGHVSLFFSVLIRYRLIFNHLKEKNTDLYFWLRLFISICAFEKVENICFWFQHLIFCNLSEKKNKTKHFINWEKIFFSFFFIIPFMAFAFCVLQIRSLLRLQTKHPGYFWHFEIKFFPEKKKKTKIKYQYHKTKFSHTQIGFVKNSYIRSWSIDR